MCDDIVNDMPIIMLETALTEEEILNNVVLYSKNEKE
jgi:hypothetical protein